MGSVVQEGPLGEAVDGGNPQLCRLEVGLQGQGGVVELEGVWEMADGREDVGQRKMDLTMRAVEGKLKTISKSTATTSLPVSRA